MYIIKNAFQNIIRNKGRNIVLGLIIFITLLAVTLSLSIHQSTKDVVEQYRSQFSSNIIITRNDDKLPSHPDDYKEPTIKEYQKFSQSELLDQTILTASHTVNLKNAKAIDEDQKDFGGVISEDGSIVSDYPFSTNMIYGTDIHNSHLLFEGTRQIISGHIYSLDNELVVSKELAQLNDWHINDQITIHFISLTTGKREEHLLKITGIYQNTQSAYDESNEIKNALTNHYNEIFTSLETMNKLNLTDSVMANFTIKDSTHIKDLAYEFYQKGLPEYFDVKVDDSEYKQIVSPVISLQSMTATITICILGAGVIIFMIVLVMTMRERQYEIGVLRAMGMKKSKIILGFFSEMVIITGICLILSFSLANLLKNPTAKILYTMPVVQTTTQEEQDVSLSSSLYTHSIKPIEQIEVKIDQKEILFISIISIIFITAASITGTYFMTKYEPLRLLSERN